MGTVKLFHDTEFAGSILQSPLAHRTALHPLAVMLLVAVWLATVGHWPLWQTLLLRTETGATGPLFATAVATQLALSALIWLAVFCWRWTFKPAITLLLIWAAFGTCVMWAQSASGEAVAVTPQGLWQFLASPAHWHKVFTLTCLGSLVVVAIVPALLIWRGRIRRVATIYQIAMTLVVLVSAFVLLAWLSGQFSHTVPTPLSPFSVLRVA
jgi:glucan phosphoethanolaminetransferase (alkaline phosphatase superfamily)